MSKRTAIRVDVAATLIIAGILIVVIPLWIVHQREYHWFYFPGWATIGLGGYCIPHRFTGGVVVGVALTMIGPRLLLLYEQWGSF